MSSSVLLKRRQKVEDFLRAFDAMLANCEANDTWLDDLPSFRPKPGREQTVARQASELQATTVVAAEIVQNLGIIYRYKPRGTMQTVPLNPVYAWKTIFDRDPMVNAEHVYDACNQAIGLLGHRAEEAYEHERSVTGRVERVSAAPRRVWRAVRGASDATSQQKTAFVSGIVVTAVGGALGTYLAHVLHWL